MTITALNSFEVDVGNHYNHKYNTQKYCVVDITKREDNLSKSKAYNNNVKHQSMVTYEKLLQY